MNYVNYIYLMKFVMMREHPEVMTQRTKTQRGLIRSVSIHSSHRHKNSEESKHFLINSTIKISFIT